MSYLVQAIGREELFTLTSELQLPIRLGDESLDSRSSHCDDDCDHLWTDVGGEG